MKRKDIDTMREVRLWIGQVIVPAVVAAVSIDRINPQLKHNIKYSANKKIGKIKFEMEQLKKKMSKGQR